MPEKIFVEFFGEFSALYPMGTNVLVAKDPDQGQSPGGIIIPEANREYRRRGWCLAPGPGVMVKSGAIVPPQYKPGDYLVFDRHFIRPDDREDEVWRNGDKVVALVKGEEVVAFWPAEDRPAPGWVRDLMGQIKAQPALR